MSLAKQAAYLAISEHMAYVNPRVAAFSQYLLSDDPPRSDGYKYGGFESGLRSADGKPKPAYEGFRLPLAVEIYGGQRRPVGPRAPAARGEQGDDRAQAEGQRPGACSRQLDTTAPASTRQDHAPLRPDATASSGPRPDGKTYTGPAVQGY